MNRVIANLASAHGFDVVGTSGDEDDVIVSGRGLAEEAALTPEDDDCSRVTVTLLYYSWSYENGPDLELHDIATLPPEEAMRLLVHVGNVDTRRNAEIIAASEAMDRAEAEHAAREQREADEHEERMLAEAGRREAELDREHG